MVSPPFIADAAFPADEREAIMCININLSSFDTYLDSFRADVEIFDFSRSCVDEAKQRYTNDRADQAARAERWKFHRWTFVAARDGAMNIYHFGRTRDGINDTLAGCPTLRKMVSKKLRVARKQLETYFPNYAKIRHGIAHTQETKSTPQAMQEHAVTGPATIKGILNKPASGGRVILNGILSDRVYTCTWEGKLLSYEISEATAEKMCSVRDAFYDAFNDAATWSRNFLRQGAQPPP